MFRTSCVYHQEVHPYTKFFHGTFFMSLCKQSSRRKEVLYTVSSTSFHLLDCLYKRMENI